MLGKTGVGKLTLIEALAQEDLSAGRGFALNDPYDDLVRWINQATDPNGRDNVVYFDATSLTHPYGYNPLRRVREDSIPLAASGLLETLKKLWPDAWGVCMEQSFEIRSMYF